MTHLLWGFLLSLVHSPSSTSLNKPRYVVVAEHENANLFVVLCISSNVTLTCRNSRAFCINCRRINFSLLSLLARLDFSRLHCAFVVFPLVKLGGILINMQTSEIYVSSNFFVFSVRRVYQEIYTCDSFATVLEARGSGKMLPSCNDSQTWRETK